MYLTSCFDENICLVSKNFPLESHRKITSLERVLLLLAEDVVGCWGLADFSLSCLPFSRGFVGGSWRGEKELDVGRFTTSNSSSFQWVHAGVEVGFSYSLFVAQIMLSSSTRGVVWLDVSVVMAFSGGCTFNFSQRALT